MFPRWMLFQRSRDEEQYILRLKVKLVSPLWKYFKKTVVQGTKHWKNTFRKSILYCANTPESMQIYGWHFGFGFDSITEIQGLVVNKMLEKAIDLHSGARATKCYFFFLSFFPLLESIFWLEFVLSCAIKVCCFEV